MLYPTRLPYDDYAARIAYKMQPRWDTRPARLLACNPIFTAEATETWDVGTETTDEPYVGYGDQSRLLTSENSAFTNALVTISTPLVFNIADTPTLEILYYVDTPANLNALLVYVGKDSSNHIRGGCSTTARTPQAAGWNLLRVKASDMTVTGTWVDANWSDGSVDYVRVTVQAKADVTVNVYVAYARMVRTMPRILIDFDDGHITAASAFSVLDSYGLRMSMAVISGLVGTAGYLPWDFLGAAYGRGHDMVNHTNADALLTTLTAGAQRIAAIKAGRHALLAHGMDRGAKILITPGGESAQTSGLTTLAADAASAGAVCARGGMPLGMNHVYPVARPYHDMGHSSVGITTTPSPGTVCSWVNDAIVAGNDLRLVFHRIGPEANSTTVPLGYFEEVARYIARRRDAGDCICPTESEAWDATHPHVLTNGVMHELTIDSANALAIARVK